MSSFVRGASRTFRLSLAFAASVLLAACSGSGAPTVENPVTRAPPIQDYQGPPAQNADVQAFSINFWQNIRQNDRCGSCHGANGQSPTFARNDDVNLAYQAANTVVNLMQPDQSRIVLKVAGGHNCWLPAASACAETLTVWIRNWAGSAASGGRQIELEEPPIREVGQSKSFPTDSALFATSQLRTLLRTNCQNCHKPTVGLPIQPYFASDDPDEGYAAARPKINLDNPELSRFVVRLGTESHNCWTNSCANDAAAMLAAVQAFADAIDPTEVDPNLVTSKAVGLLDGTVAAGGNRYDNNVIALYEFKTGTGNIAYDTSGVEPALNLTLSAPDQMWMRNWGIMIKAGQNAHGSTSASKKLADMIKPTGEFSIEAWMANANVVQEDASAITYSGGAAARNFTLGQRAYQYEAFTRTSETDRQGRQVLLTNAADEDAQAALQHVVLTYDPINGRRLYVNGEFTGDVDPLGGGGSLADWDDTFALYLGNEPSLGNQWEGVIRLLAIHNRAMTLEQIQQNYTAGVGQKYFLLFNVSHLVDVPKAYVMFEASEYDNYSYLFHRPTFISLDPNATVGTFPLAGMRIGMNGAEVKVGQSYVPLSGTVGGANYTAGTGQVLSTVGSVIGIEKGPADDLFFLTFEQIGSNGYTPPAPPPVSDPPPLPPYAGDPAPDYGVRTFDELNASYSKLTGVPTTHPVVTPVYATVKQQLPSVESIGSFLASHQTGIAQLAIAYCKAMVDEAQYRTPFFGSLAFNITDSSGSVFGTNRAAPTAARTQVINALRTNTVAAVTREIDPADFNTEINNLLADIAATGTADAGTAMKGACAAALGSAIVSVH